MIRRQRIETLLDMGKIARHEIRHVAIEAALAQRRGAVVTSSCCVLFGCFTFLAPLYLRRQPLQRIAVARIPGEAGQLRRSYRSLASPHVETLGRCGFAQS